MEGIREQFKNPLAAGILGFVVGLAIGWFVIGWGLWPVEWTDAAPGDLRPDARVDYLRMAIEAYGENQDAVKAQQRWEELGEAAPETLANVEANPGTQNPAEIEAFKAVVGSTAAGEVEEEGGIGGTLLIACLVTVVLGGVLLGLFLLRSRGGTGEVTPAMQAAEATRQAEKTDFEAIGEDTPLAQFMTTYMLGDDLFDDSFSIDSPAGEFLGECGVGIAETIGVGEPKKVTAFEVWLFDKNDIQTVTKVLMSNHAFNDQDTYERLAAKGEPVLGEAGGQIELETATLFLLARVVDMAYGDGAMPENSFFDRVTLELAVWQKM